MLEHRFPHNALLSHDLIEGAYARAALVSDIEADRRLPFALQRLQPPQAPLDARRLADCAWLFGACRTSRGVACRNPISFLSRWKILDNLRRSLVEAGTFPAVFLGWTVLPGRPLYWTLVTIAILFVPPWFQLAFTIPRSLVAWSGAPMRDGFEALVSAWSGFF